MSYQEKALAFNTFGANAIARIIDENHELFLSVDEEAVANAVVAFYRLHTDTVETAKSLDQMIVIQKRILGYLLFSGKISPASYGLSAAGKAQRDALVALVHKTPVQEDPQITEYKSFNAAADEIEFRTRVSSDTGFREWTNSK
jgi:hypothetical protein